MTFAKQLKKLAHVETEEELISKLHKASIKRQVSLKNRMRKI